MDYTKLNAKETAVLKAVAIAAEKYTGGDFTYFEEIELPEGISTNQAKGYISSLSKKGFIQVEAPGRQVGIAGQQIYGDLYQIYEDLVKH